MTKEGGYSPPDSPSSRGKPPTASSAAPVSPVEDVIDGLCATCRRTIPVCGYCPVCTDDPGIAAAHREALAVYAERPDQTMSPVNVERLVAAVDEARAQGWSAYNDVVKRYYDRGAWATSLWKGHIVGQAPADLWAYAEIIHSLEPKFVIDVGCGMGGAAWFFGDLLDGLSKGRCITLHAPGDHPPDHRRVLALSAPDVAGLYSEELVKDARDRIGMEAPVVVHFNGGGSLSDVALGLMRWSDVVTVGSYMIVVGTVSALADEDGQEAGVHQLVEAFLQVKNTDPKNPAWVADAEHERHGLTLNSGGFLYRRY